MTTPFNIIWIDDQYDEQESFWDQAERHGFEITAFKTSVEGINYLRENLHDIDALILDAKVYTNSTSDVASERGLTASLREISKLSGQYEGKEIPHVIFTGQPDLCKDDDFREKMDGIPVFSKSAPDNKPMFECLKSLIAQTTSSTLRNRYPAAYSACQKISEDGQCWRLLYPILYSFSSGKPLLTDSYNDLRKVLEYTFRYLHKYAVIHERLIENGLINLQGTSLFLAGMDARFSRESTSIKTKAPLTPKILSSQLKLILEICQAGSHTEEYLDQPSSKANIMEVEKWNSHHHLFQTATLMTLDFIVWAKAYVDANPDPETNMKNWEPICQNGNNIVPKTGGAIAESIEVECVILSTTGGGHAFVKTDHLTETGRKNIFIHKTLIGNEKLVKGSRVRVATSGEILENGALAATSCTLL
jgi:hypothetical protein